jgi:hypothetical protein
MDRGISRFIEEASQQYTTQASVSTTIFCADFFAPLARSPFGARAYKRVKGTNQVIPKLELNKNSERFNDAQQSPSSH